MLDPIDGTLNFSKGFPYYGTQLTLFEEKKAMLCIVYLPELSELYVAMRGKGAYLNGKRLKADESLMLEEIIVIYGDFSRSNPASRAVQIKSMSKVMDRAHKIRIQGASSVDFAFVSSGLNGCHIMFSRRIWEYAAGLLLCEEAGCALRVLTESEGAQGVIVAQNEKILIEIMKTFA